MTPICSATQEIDEKALIGLSGVIKIFHRVVSGRILLKSRGIRSSRCVGGDWPSAYP